MVAIRLELPPELVNLIVDQVLLLEPPSASRAALRACALISRSFAAQSRPYLWENYEFRLDRGYQERAHDLLHAAKHHTDSRTLLSSVRSIAFIYDVPTPEDWVAVETPPGRLGLIKKKILRDRRNYVHDFLNKLNCPGVQHVKVGTRGPPETFLDWGQIKQSIEPLLTDMLSSKSLKKVILHNLKNVSMDLILSVCYDSSAVDDLTISDITFSGDPVHSPLNIIPTLTSNLRRLELRPSLLVEGETRTFFSFLPISYLRLQTLVVSIPYWNHDMDFLWFFLRNLGSTLEILDMEYRIRGHAVASVQPLSLCVLTSLCKFKLTIIAPDDSSAIESSQDVLLNLLTSPNNLPKLCTLELRYCLFATSYKTHYHTEGMSLKTWREASHWPVIDNRIADDSFPSLKSLNISVEVRYQTNTCNSEHTFYASPEELKCAAEEMFPRLNATTNIKIDINGQIMFLPSSESSSRSVYFEHDERWR